MALKRQSRRATRGTTEHSSQYKQGSTHYPANPLSLGIYLIWAGRDLATAQPSERWALLGPTNLLVFLYLVEKTSRALPYPPCRAG